MGTTRVWLAVVVASLFILPALAGTQFLDRSAARRPIPDAAGFVSAGSDAGNGPALISGDDQHAAKDAASDAGQATAPAATPSETPVTGCCGFTSTKLGFPTSPLATAW
jgi:hypothetical protein